jgi:hypothetical protein
VITKQITLPAAGTTPVYLPANLHGEAGVLFAFLGRAIH